MKKEYKEVVSEIDSITVNSNSGISCSWAEVNLKVKADFNCYDYKLMHLVDVPETIREFTKINQLTKSELLDWLIKNYK